VILGIRAVSLVSRQTATDAKDVSVVHLETALPDGHLLVRTRRQLDVLFASTVPSMSLAVFASCNVWT
jgi:hypothetical protein